MLATFNLTGTVLELGINDNGSFGNGTRMAAYTGVEFYYPGTPYHEIAISAGGTFRLNWAEVGVTQIPGSSTNTSSGSTLSARFSGSALGLNIVRDLWFDNSSSLVNYSIQITNTTGSTINNVAFMDAGDPDQSTNLGWGSATYNDVVAIGGVNFVRAYSPGGSPLTVGFGSSDPWAVVSVESGWAINDPFAIINSPYDPNGALNDWAIGTAFNFGNLAPGQTVTATYASPLAATPSAADSLFQSTMQDFGDAPSSYGTATASHTASGPTLGTSRDTEATPRTPLDGTGDDVTGVADEDGLVSLSAMAPAGSARAVVNVQGVTGTHYRNAWIDFDADGDFGEANEQIATNVPVTVNGNQAVTFNVPSTAVPGASYARFRLSSTSGLTATAAAGDGEIEDYALTIAAPPTPVYVDDTWTGTTPGTNPANDPIGGLVFGYHAFSDLPSALAVVATGGTVTVFGGTYPAAVAISKPLAAIAADTNSTTLAQTTVDLSGTVTVDESTLFRMLGATNLTFSATVDAGADATGETLTIAAVAPTTDDGTLTFAGAVGAGQAPAAIDATAGIINLNAPLTATGTATLTATNGAIVDGNAGAMNITAAMLVATASAGVGSPTDPLETSLGVSNVGTTAFAFTGAGQTFTVPAGVVAISVEAWGAQGYSPAWASGGLGGYATGLLNVTPGQTLQVYVGGAGTIANVTDTLMGGGFNGGGHGVVWANGNGENYAGGGGGASDVRIAAGTLADRILVAAGGGGGTSNGTNGGHGGGLVGQNGEGWDPGNGGTGGTQVAGGSVGGTFGQGGDAINDGSTGWVGGGGGGWYGGGASPAHFGGGGGSSYIGGLANASTTAGVRSGNGLVRLTYDGQIAGRLEADGGTGGVYLDNAGRLIIGGVSAMGGVSATGGEIEINNAGVLLVDEDVVLTGAGAITLRTSTSDDLTLNANITGSGGNGSVGLFSGHDILQQAGRVSAAGSGAVAYHAGTSTADGVITMADGTQATSGTGPITMDADGDITVTGVSTGGHVQITSAAGSVLQGGNTNTDVAAEGVTVAATAGTLGAGGNPLALAVTTLTTASGGAQFLSEADTLTIGTGDVNAGSATVTLSGGTFLTTNGGTPLPATADDGDILSPVAVAGGAVLGGTGTVTGSVTAAAGARIVPGLSPGVLNTGAVSFSSGAHFDVELNGTTLGAQYDQLHVAGTVSLGSATLHVTLGFTPPLLSAFTILNNDGGDAVSGTFDELPEGTLMNLGGTLLKIAYGGGDGNDVVLAVKTPPVADAGGPYSGAEGATLLLDASGTFDHEQAQTTLRYEWDLDYDGVTFDADVTGMQPAVSFPDDFAARPIAVRVTDEDGLSDLATTTLAVTNVAPTADITGVAGGLSGGAGNPVKRIFWYDDYEESYYSGSIREYLIGRGYTVTYVPDGTTGYVNVATAYPDYDVVVAEHTCGSYTLTGLQQWFQAGKGYVALISGSMYNDAQDTYIRNLLNVDTNGVPPGETSGIDWSPSQLYWTDPTHPIANYPNSGFDIKSITPNQSQDHVAIAGGQNVVEYAPGQAALVVGEGYEGAGRVAYLGTNFHSPGATTDPDTRMLVENMIVWAGGGGGITANEGDVLTFTGRSQDPGLADDLTFDWTWGDAHSDAVLVPGDATLVRTAETTHAYGDNGTYTARLTVRDDDDGVSPADQVTVTILNVPPVIDTLAATSVDENGTVRLTGTYHDAGAGDTHQLTINWGEGAPQVVPVSGGAFDIPHEYADDNPTGSPSDVYTIGVPLTDDDTGTDTASTTTTITNVPPKLANVTVTSPIDENDTVTLAGEIVDPGTQDTFTLTVDWGEGTPETFTFAAGTTAFSQTHQYRDDNPSGTPSDEYTIKLTLSDDDGGGGGGGSNGLLYLTQFSGTAGAIVSVATGTLSSTFVTTVSTETGIAVRDTVRTVNAFRYTGAGSQYDLAGHLLNAGSYSNTTIDSLYDGTTDGQFNYAIGHNDFASNFGLFRFGLGWTNPVQIFTPTRRSSGIAYDQKRSTPASITGTTRRRSPTLRICFSRAISA